MRYELGFLLAVVVAATACAGHDEVAAQAQWAADAPGWVLRALGAEPDPLTAAISTSYTGQFLRTIVDPATPTPARPHRATAAAGRGRPDPPAAFEV